MQTKDQILNLKAKLENIKLEKNKLDDSFDLLPK